MDTNDAMHKIEETGETVQAMGESAKRTLADMSNRLKERSRAAAESTDAYVREYTWSSIALAALFGVVVGLMIRRS
jgi:ElaB/YqjD/DUF883 family membrane-anchored ribosome-binding protein